MIRSSSADGTVGELRFNVVTGTNTLTACVDCHSTRNLHLDILVPSWTYCNLYTRSQIINSNRTSIQWTSCYITNLTIHFAVHDTLSIYCHFMVSAYPFRLSSTCRVYHSFTHCSSSSGRPCTIQVLRSLWVSPSSSIPVSLSPPPLLSPFASVLLTAPFLFPSPSPFHQISSAP